ncbi:hypothetical protein GVAV_001011 [Gurleya vavrai]
MKARLNFLRKKEITEEDINEIYTYLEEKLVRQGIRKFEKKIKNEKSKALNHEAKMNNQNLENNKETGNIIENKHVLDFKNDLECFKNDNFKVDLTEKHIEFKNIADDSKKPKIKSHFDPTKIFNITDDEPIKIIKETVGISPVIKKKAKADFNYVKQNKSSNSNHTNLGMNVVNEINQNSFKNGNNRLQQNFNQSPSKDQSNFLQHNNLNESLIETEKDFLDNLFAKPENSTNQNFILNTDKIINSTLNPSLSNKNDNQIFYVNKIANTLNASKNNKRDTNLDQNNFNKIFNLECNNFSFENLCKKHGVLQNLKSEFKFDFNIEASDLKANEKINFNFYDKYGNLI